MSDLEIWITIAALGLATAITRSSFWLIGHHINIPKRVQEMLRYAPACALAAIIAPDLLMEGPKILQFDTVNLKLASAVAATVYYLLRRNMLEMILFGMIVFTALRIWFT